MPTFEATIEIRADANALFDLTQDYDRRLDWDPFLKQARLVGGATAAGVGVRAWCVARSGLGMETEYVSFQRPQVAARNDVRPSTTPLAHHQWRLFCPLYTL
jgi:Polyketide cyclase / dehydrase and lipid transport